MKIFVDENGKLHQLAEEIVRCKNCKWWHPDEHKQGFGNCGQGYWLHDGEWFCADGEPKDTK